MDELNKHLEDILKEGCDDITDDVIFNSDLLKKTLEDCCCGPSDGILIKDLKNPIDENLFISKEKEQSKIDEELQNNINKLDQCLKDINSKVSSHTNNINNFIVLDNLLFKLNELRDLYEPVYQYHFELKNQIDILLQKRQSYLDTINPIRRSIIDFTNKIRAKETEKSNYLNNNVSPNQVIIDRFNAEITNLKNQQDLAQINLNTLVDREKTEINSDVILSSDYSTAASSQDRRDLLNSYIKNILSSSTINQLANSYASNLYINDYNIAVTGNLSFKILFDYLKYNTDLNDNITTEYLQNNQLLNIKTFLNNVGLLEFQQTQIGYKYSGTLYSQYYNLFEDPINNFFTLEERGLTTDITKIDINLIEDIKSAKISGLDISNSVKVDINGNSYYIQDFQKFQDFNTTVQSNLNIRLEEVKRNIVKPVLDNLINSLKELANKQSKYIISYGDLFNSTLINDDSIISPNSQIEIQLNINSDLSNIINIINQMTNSIKTSYNDLVVEIERLDSQRQDFSSKMKNFKNDLTSIPCAKEQSKVDEEPGIGIDPLGKQTLKTGGDITKPNPGKWCYWLKFASIITLCGVTPIPGGRTGFRYWPFGLVIPSPTGVKKIPLPTIFIPITVISSRLGTIVIFIAQCGILPCPLIFYISNSGTKKNIVMLKGQSENYGQPKNENSVKDTIQLKYNTFKNLAEDKLQKIGINKTDKELLEKTNKGQSFDEFVEELYSDIEKKIDAIQLPEMTNFNNLKNELGQEINNLSKTEKIDIIKKDFIEYINNIDFPTFELPKDKNKINPRKESNKSTSDLFKDFNTNKNIENIEDKLNLKIQILNEIDNININDEDLQPEFNEVPIDDNNIDKIKKEWNKIISKSFDNLKNNQELAFTLLNVNELSSINITNPFQCKTEQIEISTNIPSLATITIIGFKTIIDNILNKLSSENIRKLTDLNTLSSSKLKDSLKIIINRLAPIKSLPENLYNFNLQNTTDNVLSNINKITEKSFKIGPTQKEFKVDLNKLKGPIKSTFSKTIDITLRTFPLNIDDSFDKFTSVDMKILLKNTIRNSMNSASNIFKGPFNAVNSLKSIKKINIMDITTGLLKNPKIESENSVSDKLTITNIDALNKSFKLLENTSIIPFIGALFLAGTGSSEILRNFHPILNYDDLPPWERLSFNNFIFMLFVDQFLVQNVSKNGF